MASVIHQPHRWTLAGKCVSFAQQGPAFRNTPRRQYWWSGESDNVGKQEEAAELDLEQPSPLLLYRRAQRRTSNVPRRIHILGAGNIGGFVAHSLAGIPNPPPITLLLSSRSSLNSWFEHGESIKLTTKGLMAARKNIDVEVVRHPVSTADAQEVHDETNQVFKDRVALQDNTIHNLIVSVKAFSTVDALRRVAHRLTPQSSVLFIQNGMGIIDEVNDRVFPDPVNRPQYLLGVISHGVYEKRRFDLVHGGHGTVALAILPRNTEEISPAFEPSALFLLRTLTRTPSLAAVGFSPTDLFQLQIEKLAVNAIINPLTALMGVSNGELLYQPSMSRVIRLLLAEISLVIRSLPELQGVPNVNVRYHIRRLEGQVISVAQKTAMNRSSTLQDISRGRFTEIRYITGYIVRRGEGVGIQCVLNYMLMHMITAKQRMEGVRQGNLLPLEPRSGRIVAKIH